MLDQYTYFGWAPLEAVLCLRLAPHDRARRPSLLQLLLQRRGRRAGSAGNWRGRGWRRRESNPGPEVIHASIYVRIPVICIAARNAHRAGFPVRYRPYCFASLPGRVEEAIQIGDASTGALEGSPLRRLSIQLFRPRERRCYRSHLSFPRCF